MATIPASEARKQYTSILVSMLQENMKVYGFLRSFFPTKESVTKYVTIETKRGYEKIAKNKVRGASATLNKFSYSNEKKFEPPYFREEINMTDVDLYDAIWGVAADAPVEEGVFIQFMENLNTDLMKIINKIERALELMASQVFQTGIITLETGDNIDFKRESLSKVDLGSGNYWTTDANNPINTIRTGCDWIRQKGKYQGEVMNVIFGDAAWEALLNNQTFQDRSDVKDYALANVREAQRNAEGGNLLGRITAGGYNVNCWGYNEGYDDDSNGFVKYINTNNIVVLPEKPNFVMAFAAVPQIFGDGAGPLKKGAYVSGELVIPYDGVHKRDVKSAGIPIPTAVDQIWTGQVVGS